MPRYITKKHKKLSVLNFSETSYFYKNFTKMSNYTIVLLFLLLHK